MDDVIIIRVRAGSYCQEAVSFSCAKVVWTYTQEGADGVAADNVTFGWNFPGGKSYGLGDCGVSFDGQLRSMKAGSSKHRYHTRKQGPILVLMLAIVAVVSYCLLPAMTNADVEASNKQVLVNTFQDLVRYALLRTYRDLERLGVTPGSFSVDSLNSSLSARSNAGIIENRAPSVKTLLQESRGPSLTFHFYWAGNAGEPLEAAFALSYKPGGDLEVKLLWLGLPERIPISPAAGVMDGRKPFEEAVYQLLRVLKGGRIEPYPSPQ